METTAACKLAQQYLEAFLRDAKVLDRATVRGRFYDVLQHGIMYPGLYYRDAVFVGEHFMHAEFHGHPMSTAGPEDALYLRPHTGIVDYTAMGILPVTPSWDIHWTARGMGMDH